MSRQSILYYIRQLNKPVFTTGELSAVSGKSSSAVVQSLNFLQKQGAALRIYKGIWADSASQKLNAYSVIPFLFPLGRAYVSFVSALHSYGIIEQIPQEITLASTAHTRTISTKLAVFSAHHIAPAFFAGFDWYKGSGNFLIAKPEKALVDCLYLSAYKNKQFEYFPELRFSKKFSFKKAEAWLDRIKNIRVRSYVMSKLDGIREQNRRTE